MEGNSHIKYLLDFATEIAAIVQHKTIDFTDSPASKFPPIKFNSILAFFLADANANFSSHLRHGRDLILCKGNIVLKIALELLDGQKVALLRRNNIFVSINNRNLLLFGQLKKFIEAKAINDLLILNLI